MSKARDIVFKSSHRKSNTKKPLLPAFNNDEVNSILKKIQDSGQVASVMTVKEPFNEMFVSGRMATNTENTTQTCVTPDLQQDDRLSLMNYFNISHSDKTIEELRQLANTINISYTQSDVQYIENTTKSQTSSPLWFKLRAGRITASNFKIVCTTTVNRPAISTITKICYPKKFTSKQTEYGLKNEFAARQAYTEYMKKLGHQNFEVHQRGLCVNNVYPHIGASPDGVWACDCCGKGILEIKCPITANNFATFSEYSSSKYSSIEKKGRRGYILKRNHAHYFQIQMQMFVLDLNVAHYVIWKKSGILVLTINKNISFWDKYYPKTESFFKYVLLPEIIGKCYTKNNVSNTSLNGQ